MIDPAVAKQKAYDEEEEESVFEDDCEKTELPPLSIEDLEELQKTFKISFVFAKEALDNSNGDVEEAKKYISQRLGE